jgi:two-component system NarL family response regulator
MPRSVLIVDDHPLVPQALSAVIEERFPRVRALQAASLRQARAVYQVEPSLAACVLDLKLPDAGGLDGLSELVSLRPDIGVVVFTALEGAPLRREALELGAAALISKTEPTGILLDALASLLSGPKRSAADVDPEVERKSSLSVRQQQIWQALAEGLSNVEIAARYQISLNTTKAHVRELLQRLGVRNRTEAATLYLRRARPLP